MSYHDTLTQVKLPLDLYKFCCDESCMRIPDCDIVHAVTTGRFNSTQIKYSQEKTCNKKFSSFS